MIHKCGCRQLICSGNPWTWQTDKYEPVQLDELQELHFKRYALIKVIYFCLIWWLLISVHPNTIHYVQLLSWKCHSCSAWCVWTTWFLFSIGKLCEAHKWCVQATCSLYLPHYAALNPKRRWIEWLIHNYVLRVCEESRVLNESLLDITTNVQHSDKT